MNQQAKFTQGSTMRHVAIMTFTGMIGITFMFLVDAVTLFWVAQLDKEIYIAAIGYAWTIQIFTISMAVAFMIAGSALVARALGAKEWDNARRFGTSSLVISVLCLTLAVIIILPARDLILGWAGASGQTLEIASRFLLISVPSLPFMVLGMTGSGILRAEGDALRSMVGTMSTGLVAMIVDPLFIYTFQLEVYGAALGISVSRILSAFLVLYFVMQKDLLAPIRLPDIQISLRPFFIIAVPALLTQISTPVGNFITTAVISQEGEAAVAGWAVMNRILVLAFGGVFALSGVIGGIIGQNYGAGLFDRVKTAYRDAIIFSTAFVLCVWLAMILATPLILRAFGVSEGATPVVTSFTYFVAGSFVFAGLLYVANASVNNLGRPGLATIFNWIKDGVLILPLSLLGAHYYGAVGVVYATGVAWTVTGLIAGWVGWRVIHNVERSAQKA